MRNTRQPALFIVAEPFGVAAAGSRGQRAIVVLGVEFGEARGAVYHLDQSARAIVGVDAVVRGHA